MNKGMEFEDFSPIFENENDHQIPKICLKCAIKRPEYFKFLSSPANRELYYQNFIETSRILPLNHSGIEKDMREIQIQINKLKSVNPINVFKKQESMKLSVETGIKYHIAEEKPIRTRNEIRNGIKVELIFN